MFPTSRSVAATLMALGLLASTHAVAESYPSRPIRFIVPVGTGSGYDSNTRFVADQVAKLLNSPTFVENKPGAGGVIGASALVGAPADGYTVLAIAPSVAINAVIRPDLPYDTVKDIRPIAGMTRADSVLVTAANSRFKSLNDVLDAMKKAPGRVSYGYYSDFYRLGVDPIEKAAGGGFNHIPYKAASEVTTALLSGTIDVAMFGAAGISSQIAAGKLRGLGVTGKERLKDPALASVPTIQEAGVAKFELPVWTGFAVRTGTPEAVATKLADAITKVVSSPQYATFIAQQNENAFPATPAEMSKLLSSEIAKYKAMGATAAK